MEKENIIKSFIYDHFFNCCGCDACHWDAWDFKFFYFFKDWDVDNPKWKFGIRTQY